MKANNIIFADLSTYTPLKTIKFYEAVFSWKFHQSEDYHVAYCGSTPIIGLYETPNEYKALKMPHFWMTYIWVTSVSETLERAKALGGKIEAEVNIPEFGRVALIRDPAGAGFTVYDGDKLTTTRTQSEPNSLVWNELLVHDIAQVRPFYEALFNWQFEEHTLNNWNIFHSDGEHISNVTQVQKDIQKQYWICTFAVNKLSKTLKKIEKRGGKVLYSEASRTMVTDNSHEAFFYLIEV